MPLIEMLIALLLISIVLALTAKRLNFPYPIALLVAGLGVASIPGVPQVRIDPEIIFYILLPPILSEAAYFTSWRDFRRWRRAILLLAFGLVTMTTVVVACICRALIPGMSWATGFLLGAIVSPPDAAAATAIMRNLRLPRRVVQILEGESLVNDAAALTVYRFAIAAIVSGTFSFPVAVLTFFWITAAGIAVGIGLGLLLVKIYPYFKDSQVEILSTFLLSFTCYVAAEAIHASGVLAVVASGLIFGWYAPRLFSATTRIRAGAVWESTTFLVNSTIFLSIGLELPRAMAALHIYRPADLALWSAALSAVVIITRILWVYPGTYIPRVLSKRIREKEPAPSVRAVSVVAWTGLRGVVSLAAAEALPIRTNTGPFPHRDLILFLAFVVIMVTLVLQGLSLRPFVKWLQLPLDRSVEEEHLMASIHAAERALERLVQLEQSRGVNPSLIDRVRGYYNDRLVTLRAELELAATPDRAARPEEFQSIAEQQIWWELAKAEREAVLLLRRERRIGDDAMRRIEHDIDLLEARIVPHAAGE